MKRWAIVLAISGMTLSACSPTDIMTMGRMDKIKEAVAAREKAIDEVGEKTYCKNVTNDPFCQR